MLQAAGEADASTRPFWHWVGFAAASIFIAWLPLTALAAALASRMGAGARDEGSLRRAAVAAVAAYGAAILLGALAGGYLVGRWSPPAFGVRAAALGGLGATGVAALISWAGFGFSMAPWLAAALAVPMAAFGGQLGTRRAAGRPALPPL